MRASEPTPSGCQCEGWVAGRVAKVRPGASTAATAPAEPAVCKKLANEEEFRHEVFQKFSAEYEQLLPAGPVDWRMLLNLVAAVNPASPSANDFVEPAAQILRIRPDEVRSALDRLEKHGLLLRGGRLIRIVPDLLSDFLLEGACLTGAGESTGFADLMFATFQSTYLSNLLRNLGELDWRITQRNLDQGTRLLDRVWEEIGGAFDAGDASVRVQLLKSLTGASLFQPVRVLQLIHRAIANEATEVRVWLRQTDPARYRTAGIAAATHTNAFVGYGAANAVSYGPNLNQPLPEDAAILQELAKHTSSMVRHLTFTGIRRLGEHAAYEREAIEMLLAADIGSDVRLAEEMCGAVDYHGIDKAHLSEEQVRVMLDKLVATVKIDDHHIERFLAWVGDHFPAALFEFTLRRLDRYAGIEAANEKKADYDPIPNTRFGNAFRPLQNSPQYRSFLDQVTARFTTQREQGYWLRGLFWSIGSIDATTLGVIDELVHRGDKDSVRDALQLIGGAPPELLLSRPHFAAHIVEEAGRVDLQLGSSAESAFLGNALSGSFN